MAQNLSQQLYTKGKGISNLTNLGTSFAGFAQKPSLRTGLSGFAKYAANRNPYIAGANAVTGGLVNKGIDALFSIGRKRGPAQDPLATQQSIDWAKQSADEFNRMRNLASQSATDAQRFAEEQKNYRASVRNILDQGASARQLMPFMAQAAARNAQLGQSAEANLAANLSRRGLSASPQASGIEAGAMAGLQAGLAGQQGQTMSALQSAALNRALAGQQQLFAADTAGYQNAMARQAALEQAAAGMPMAQQQFELERLKNEQALAMAKQGIASQNAAAFGQGLVGLYNAYQASRQPKTSPLDTIIQYLKMGAQEPSTQSLGNQASFPVATSPGFKAPSRANSPFRFTGDVTDEVAAILDELQRTGRPTAYGGQRYYKNNGIWYKV